MFDGRPSGQRHVVRLAVAIAVAAAAPAQASDQAGTVYRIVLKHESESESSDGSRSSSSGTDAVIERVVEETAEGLILEYDLVSEDGLPHGRQDQWQYPFRVIKPLDGPARLLDAAELEARIARWLEHLEMPRSACGSWIFTWTAVQVECDPQSLVAGIARFDMRPAPLRDGALYWEPGASGPSAIRQEAIGPAAASYVVELAVDADWVRHGEAEADVAVGEIMREPITLEEALLARSAEEIAGTITIVFETDADGAVRRRTKVMKLETRKPDGIVETSRDTETLERVLLPR